MVDAFVVGVVVHGGAVHGRDLGRGLCTPLGRLIRHMLAGWSQHMGRDKGTHSSLVDGSLADAPLDVAKLILSVTVQLGRYRRSGGVGEREVLVVVLISLPYRYRWGDCGRRGACLIRRRGRKAGWAAHRRRLYKVVDVHGIRVRRCWRSLRLLVDRAPQLLRNAAGCAFDGRPWGSCHGGALGLALALAQALALAAHTGSSVSNVDGPVCDMRTLYCVRARLHAFSWPSSAMSDSPCAPHSGAAFAPCCTASRSACPAGRCAAAPRATPCRGCWRRSSGWGISSWKARPGAPQHPATRGAASCPGCPRCRATSAGAEARPEGTRPVTAAMSPWRGDM